jgi:CheY-specific phosphatase CheX
MLKTLRAATFEVLETMFFLLPESPEETEPYFTGTGLRARVPVTGPKAFSVGLTVPLGLARYMGANFLGAFPDQLSQEMLDDVVRELANMVAGVFLRSSGASVAFQLLPPTLEHVELPGLGLPESPSRLFLEVSDFGLELFVEMAPRVHASQHGRRQPQANQSASPA